MSCRACEEQLLLAARAGPPPTSAAEHLACCEACRAFALQVAAVRPLLATWEATPPASTAATRAALAAKLAHAQQRRRRASGHFTRLMEHPAVLALLGAGALAAGVAVAPIWLQCIALGWFAVAALLVSLVLLHQERRFPSGGEGS